MPTVGFITSVTSIKFGEMIKFVRMIEIGRTIKVCGNHHLLESTLNEFEFLLIIERNDSVTYADLTSSLEV